MKKLTLFFTMIVALVNFTSCNSSKELEKEVSKIIKDKDLTLGYSFMDLNNPKDSLIINGDKKFSMMSVFKFPIALAVLDKVDKGEYRLEDKIKISKDMMDPNTHSPLRDKYPNGSETTLKELIFYMVNMSDNIACDYLLKEIGGPKYLESYMHNIGIKDMGVTSYEIEMRDNWDKQYENWITPNASMKLLTMFYKREIPLSKNSYDVLWEIMSTPALAERISVYLPKSVVVAHKTGSSYTRDGLTAATNDIGIVVDEKNDKAFVVSILLRDTKESAEVNSEVISQISKSTWNYIMKQ